ncbi:DNA topoisomerase 2 [Tilletia horrida]|uniref:DNA topoisomerase 2 n=1 Tax=Tilletia horrida TaxID=155126 RepID=A0AAN6GV24_9BASI|nr:DNA topoisomerase 2 [Tilletia horrida]KAK0555424.1 DNA topoisomerase 2 [Tilletia horrida]KAK0568816.1 DNA topoisomerase 2 [Tilletia horrida]
MDSDSDFYVDENTPPRKKLAVAKKPAAKSSVAKVAAAKTAAKVKAATAEPKAKTTTTSKAKAKAKIIDEDEDDEDFDDYNDDEPISRPKASAPAPKADGKSATQTYQKMTQLEHVLKRPDTYIGSVEPQEKEVWVYDSAKEQMAYRKITYTPGFYKIFDEILVNAADNKVRDPTMDTLKVTIDKTEGSITVWNNGKGIPVEIHEEEKIYIPELIFGHLLTSSNYDDDEAKVTGGRNGYGAKLANIYSTEFTVETADKEKKYKQTFRDNMSQRDKPKVTANPKKAEYTSITFKPDFARFKMTDIDADIEALMKKRVFDMAGTIKDVKVLLNGERLKIKNFKSYVEMYVAAISDLSHEPIKTEEGEDAPPPPPKQSIIFESVEDKGKLWEVAFTPSDGKERNVSFVNNIATIEGGTHVEMIKNQLITKISDHIKKDKKAAAVRSSQIANQLWIFVNCQIVNPTFDGQTKEKLTLARKSFGSSWNMSDKFGNQVIKSGVLDNIMAISRAKQESQLKKTDGYRRARIVGIPKLEDANNAGTRKSADCTLILTEGDSAKASAVGGLAVVGRDNWGVFPLRGKLLNVREASHDAIMKNTEIKNIKEILGLQHNKVYTSTDSLRYGSLMIMTDQDHDGSHIKGLILNFFDHFYPSLLKLPNFLVEFITPIVRAKQKNREFSFFTIPEYQAWASQQEDVDKWKIKYYKGLGTIESDLVRKYFSALNKHMLPFETTQPGDRELIDLAFNKKKADDRKEWLRQFVPGTYLDHNITKVPIADFINKELILFSMADNMRSIPSVVDGLKPGQRKIMFACFKRNLRTEVKVAQLAGYVGEHTAYHHGEASLLSTIVGLAQDFCGANNANILAPIGQFGTRAMGGKDAASPRYIFTNLLPITRALFHRSDDPVLNYLNDDGQSIEPEWYMPTIPLVLVNGGDGIGTGWATSIPNYNPKDIIANLKRRMAGEELVPMNPWYRGFTGTIERTAPDKYKCSGTYRETSEGVWEITELPIRVWTSTYKEGLEERVQGSEKVPATVKEYKEYHTDRKVKFIVELNAKGKEEVAAKGPEAFFKLSTTISTGNMVAFDPLGKIHKYTTPEAMLEDFYLLRLSFYQRRKEHLVEELKMRYERLSNQARFVKMIIDRELIVSNRKRKDIVVDLRKHNFRPFPKQVKAVVAADVDQNVEPEEQEEISADNDYDYLLTMAIYNLTKEKVDKLLAERDAKEMELNILLKKSPQDLWYQDLKEFEEIWDGILADDEARERAVGETARKGKGKAKPTKVGASSKATASKSGGAKKRSAEDSLMDELDDDFVGEASMSQEAVGSRKPSGRARKQTKYEEVEDDDEYMG